MLPLFPWEIPQMFGSCVGDLFWIPTSWSISPRYTSVSMLYISTASAGNGG